MICNTILFITPPSYNYLFSLWERNSTNVAFAVHHDDTLTQGCSHTTSLLPSRGNNLVSYIATAHQKRHFNNAVIIQVPGSLYADAYRGGSTSVVRPSKQYFKKPSLHNHILSLCESNPFGTFPGSPPATSTSSWHYIIAGTHFSRFT